MENQSVKIVFIGAGNLATCLSVAMQEKGFDICQIYSKTEASAQTLGERLGCAFTTSLKEVVTDADLYLFSVKDTVLPEVISGMNRTGGIWAHTAGSMSEDIFREHHAHYGVFYPLQTFSKNRTVDFSSIPFFIEARIPDDKRFLKTVAGQLSEKVIEADSEQRKYLHLAAVFACNFTNHMYDIAAHLLKEHRLPFELLVPLIDETAAKIHKMSPGEAQTGPAIRYDQNVMDKHLALLKDDNLKNIYSELSKNIHSYSIKKDQSDEQN